MAIRNVELMHECFPMHSPMGTGKNEIRLRNRRRLPVGMSEYGKKYTADKKIRSPDGLTVAWAYGPPWSLLHEAVDELPNKPNIHLKVIYCTLGGAIIFYPWGTLICWYSIFIATVV